MNVESHHVDTTVSVPPPLHAPTGLRDTSPVPLQAVTLRERLAARAPLHSRGHHGPSAQRELAPGGQGVASSSTAHASQAPPSRGRSMPVEEGSIRRWDRAAALHT